jgi:hypothetical protein
MVADPGDRFADDAFEKMAATLNERMDVSVVYADFYAESGPRRLGAFEREWLLLNEGISPHPMWRRSLHQRLGFFDADMHLGGDYEFWLRVSTRHKLLHMPEVLSYPWQNNCGISAAEVDRRAQECDAARDRYWAEEADEQSASPRERRTQVGFEKLSEQLAVLSAGKRVALFGAGKHTLRMMDRFRRAIEPRHRIVAILDDRAQGGTTLAGMAVRQTENWQEAGIDMIVASSDAYEATMIERAQQVTAGRVKVFGLYRHLPEILRAGNETMIRELAAV